jgi:hypothetical protein
VRYRNLKDLRLFEKLVAVTAVKPLALGRVASRERLSVSGRLAAVRAPVRVHAKIISRSVLLTGPQTVSPLIPTGTLRVTLVSQTGPKRADLDRNGQEPGH